MRRNTVVNQELLVREVRKQEAKRERDYELKRLNEVIEKLEK